MTNLTRKRVVTLDDLNVLNQNAAYARQKGEEADAAALRAVTAAEQAELAAGHLPDAAEAAGHVGDAREAAGYLAPLAAAKDQADQNHARAEQDHQTVVENVAASARQQDANDARQAANNIITERVGTLSTSRNLSISGPQSTYPTVPANVYWSGWASSAGPRQDFNRVKVWIRPYDAAKPVTSLQLRVLSGDSTGAVLATKNVSVATQTGVAQALTFDLGSTVANAGGANIWIEVSSPERGYFVLLGTSQVYAAPAQYQHGLSGNWVAVTGGSYITYAEFDEYSATGHALALTAEMIALIRAGNPDGITAKTLTDRVGSLGPQITSRGESGPATAYSLAGTDSNFWYGWLFPVGVRQNFNRTRVRLKPFGTGALPTVVRAVLKNTDQNGAVLADVTFTRTFTAGDQEVTINWGATIANAGAAPLWLEVMTDAKVTALEIAANTYATTARYTGNGNVAAPSTNVAVGGLNFWAAFEFVDANTLLLTPTTEFANIIKAYTPSTAKGDTAYDQLLTLGRPLPILTGTSESVTLANSGNFFISNLSVGQAWYGWASGVGVRQNFNAVKLFVYPANPAALPTKLRVRVRETDSNGAVLGDVTVNLSGLTALTRNAVVVQFPTTITNAGGLPLYLEYWSDQHVALVGQQTSPPYNAVFRYATSAGAITTGSMSNGGPLTNIYAVFGTVSATPGYEFILSGSIWAQNPSAQPDLTSIFTASIHLPSVIPAVVGRELNIYYQNVIKSWHPLRSFTIRVTTTKGKTENHRWTFTPAAGDVGDVALTLSVWWNGVQVATKAVTVRVAAVNAATAVTRKLLSIADSTTETGRWLGEIETNISALSNVKIQTVGTRTTTNTGNGPTAKTEARSGWSVQRFYNDAASPFVFGGVFNFAQYLTNNPSVTLSAGDWVYFNLGINDLMFAGDDTSTNAKIDTMFTQMDAMIASIKAAVAGVRIAVDIPIPPSNEVGAAFGIYGSQVQFIQYARNRHTLAERILAKYGGREAENLHVFGGDVNFDVEDMATWLTATVSQSARSATQVTVRTDGVHPSLTGPGYLQKADMIYSHLRVLEG